MTRTFQRARPGAAMRTLLLVAIGPLSLWACTSDAPTSSAPSTPPGAMATGDEDSTGSTDDVGGESGDSGVPGGDEGAGDAEPATVTIVQSRFPADDIRVAVGTPVLFENTDPFAHTVEAADSSSVAFDSGELLEGETFEVTFDAPGEYAYFCAIHPTMRASVVVDA